MEATTTSSTSYSRKRKRQHNKKSSDFAEEARRWMYSNRDFSDCQDRIVFVSYNILGVQNSINHPHLYRGVRRMYLDWDYRRRILHEEIRNYKPGIICLQEVDRFEDLGDLFQKDGYKGVYKGRTGEASDGCAIFWNRKLFRLKHEESIEFKSFGLRDNVCQFCVFKLKKKKFSSSRSFVVGNTHLLFNPNRGDIKLGQMRLFLEKAHALSEERGNIPVVLGGDFNSMPQSAMYKFLTSSELNVRQHDPRQISGQIIPPRYSGFQHSANRVPRFRNSENPFLHEWSKDQISLATGSILDCLSHPLKICSSYVGVPGSTKTRNGFGEPLATSFHSQFMGTVDYIWHTKELNPVRVLDTLPISTLREIGGLPSKQWGSDHFALVCELAFSDDQTREDGAT